MHLKLIAVIMLVAAMGMVGLAFGSGPVLLTTSTVGSLGIGWAWPGLIHHVAFELFPKSRALPTSYMQTQLRRHGNGLAAVWFNRSAHLVYRSMDVSDRFCVHRCGLCVTHGSRDGKNARRGRRNFEDER
ncbi:hypothetical protein AB0299_20350 [Pseudarthrobacter sp. NPDC080037]|uniref:hypothetical protein n=1 Tax=Pseudarthrobacter sp. NPDC080037 TaxID=3155289 RepID=UPI00344F85A6